MTALEELKEQLVSEWDETDARTREQLDAEFAALPHPGDGMKAYVEAMRDICGRYTQQQRELRHMTPSDIHQANTKAADKMIENLTARVQKKIGKITSWDGLQTNPDNEGFMVLNGWFTGESGTCEVRSISAGGYNIQKRHIRVLLK